MSPSSALDSEYDGEESMKENVSISNVKHVEESKNKKSRVRVPSTKITDANFVIGAGLNACDNEDMKRTREEKTTKDRNRVNRFVTVFEPSMLKEGNPYGFSPDAHSGFETGQRVCIKGFYCDDSTFAFIAPTLHSI
jgi:hypothetical protein